MRFSGLILANLGRNKLRTLLTGTAVALAVMLVSLLLTMPAGLDAFLDEAASNVRICVHNKAGLVYSMPASFVRKVRQLKGVEAALASVWFGGAYEEDGQVTFPSFAVEADQIAAVYPDYGFTAQEVADFRRYRDGAIVGAQTMQKYGWKVGDRVTLRSTVWPVDLDLRIVGEMRNDQAPMVWVNRDGLDEALKAKGRGGLGIVGVIYARVADPALVGPVMREVDELFRNSEAETASETEKSFFASFFGSLQTFLSIVMIVTALVSLCIVFIAANTASMAVRERAGEIAVLKAIGFGRRAIFGMLFTEALLLASVSGGIGVGLAVLFTRSLSAAAGWNPSLGPLAAFVVTPAVVGQGLLLSLLVGLFAGLAPAWGAARRPVVETLREVF